MYRFEIILTIIFILILNTGIMMDIKDNNLLKPVAKKNQKKFLIHGDQLVDNYFSRFGRFDYLKDVAFYYAFVLEKLGIKS